MSRRQRARIERAGPGDSIPRPDPSELPIGATALGPVRRGDQCGILLRLASGRYVCRLADGTTTALPADKVEALLASEIAP